MAAATATLDYIEKNNLLEHVQKSALFSIKLSELIKSPIVGDVRGED